MGSVACLSNMVAFSCFALCFRTLGASILPNSPVQTKRFSYFEGWFQKKYVNTFSKRLQEGPPDQAMQNASLPISGDSPALLGRTCNGLNFGLQFSGFLKKHIP